MTEPLRVGQFAIIDHEPVERGPNAGVFQGKGPADDRAELYILAEGTTPAGESFAGHIVSAAGQSWQTLDMSVTGALRRIFEDTAASLADWNRKSIAQHRVSLGLSCIARRGDQVVIAQAGPSILFHRTMGKLQTVSPDAEHGQPLGASARVEPQFTRLDLKPGDRVLLISTAALADLDMELVEGILALEPDRVLGNLFRRVQHLRHVTVLFVAAPDVSAESVIGQVGGERMIDATPMLPSPPQPPPRPMAIVRTPEPRTRAVALGTFQPSLFIDDEEGGDALAAARRQITAVAGRLHNAAGSLPMIAPEIPRPLQRAAGDNELARLAAERRSHATLLLATNNHAAAGAGRATWRSLPGGVESDLEARRRHRRRDSFSRSLQRDEPAPRPIIVDDGAPLAADMAAEVSARPLLTGPVSEAIATDNFDTVTSGGALVRVRTTMPSRGRGGRALSGRSVLTPEKLPPTWAIILGGLAVLIVVVGYLVVPGLLNRGDDQQYSTLIDQATQKLSTAHAMRDAGDKRTALQEAQGLLLQARDLPGAGSQVTDFLTQLNGELATLDAVRTPATVTAVASLQQFGDKPVAATRMVVSDANAYVLDSASSQVISLPLSGGTDAATAATHPAVYAENRDASQDRPVAMVWADGNDLGRPSLLVLDASRNLWAFSPSLGLRPVVFAAPPSLTVTDITMFGRDLYALDGSAGAVYRFTPGDGGYVSPVKVLDLPGVTSPARLTVNGDDIYVTDSAANIHWFAGQLSLELSEGGIDKKLIAPEAAQTADKSGELYVLDAPNNRIVVLRQDGGFDHQYQHKDFQGLSAFVLQSGGAYVFSSGTLRHVTW